MEETGLPLLTGRRSWVTELSKDRSLGDRQATGPAPWCGAQGLGQSRGQALPSACPDPLRPRSRGAAGTQPLEARYMEETPKLGAVLILLLVRRLRVPSEDPEGLRGLLRDGKVKCLGP